MSMRSAALAVLLALFAILPTAAEAAVAKIPVGAKIAVMPIGAYGDAAVYDAGRAASEYVMAVLRKESRYTLYDCDPEIVADRLDELGLSLRRARKYPQPRRLTQQQRIPPCRTRAAHDNCTHKPAHCGCPYRSNRHGIQGRGGLHRHRHES